jgi:hypothetical protein
MDFLTDATNGEVNPHGSPRHAGRGSQKATSTAAGRDGKGGDELDGIAAGGGGWIPGSGWTAAVVRRKKAAGWMSGVPAALDLDSSYLASSAVFFFLRTDFLISFLSCFIFCNLLMIEMFCDSVLALEWLAHWLHCAFRIKNTYLELFPNFYYQKGSSTLYAPKGGLTKYAYKAWL